MYTRYSPVRRSSAKCKHFLLPLDLHVLGLPLAFILSQDQTLHCIINFKPYFVIRITTQSRSSLRLKQCVLTLAASQRITKTISSLLYSVRYLISSVQRTFFNPSGSTFSCCLYIHPSTLHPVIMKLWLLLLSSPSLLPLKLQSLSLFPLKRMQK